LKRTVESGHVRQSFATAGRSRWLSKEEERTIAGTGDADAQAADAALADAELHPGGPRRMRWMRRRRAL
jgi:hypothetical protein